MEKYVLAGSLGMLLCFGCIKSRGPAISQLPPATQTGANTFGCLINGQAFIPKTKFLSNDGLNFNYGFNYSTFIAPDSLLKGPDGWFFIISGKSTKGCDSRYLTLELDSIPLVAGMTYPIGLRKAGQASATFGENNCQAPPTYFLTSDTLPGTLTITKADIADSVYSGVFQFMFVAAPGDTIKVTNGRFDLKIP